MAEIRFKTESGEEIVSTINLNEGLEVKDMDIDHEWTLDTIDIDGNTFHVDFTGGRPNDR